MYAGTVALELRGVTLDSCTAALQPCKLGIAFGLPALGGLLVPLCRLFVERGCRIVPFGTRAGSGLMRQQQGEQREVAYLCRFDVPRQGCLTHRLAVDELLRTHQRTFDQAYRVIRLT